MKSLNRRSFLKAALLGCAGAVLAPEAALAETVRVLDGSTFGNAKWIEDKCNCAAQLISVPSGWGVISGSLLGTNTYRGNVTGQLIPVGYTVDFPIIGTLMPDNIAVGATVTFIQGVGEDSSYAAQPGHSDFFGVLNIGCGAPRTSFWNGFVSYGFSRMQMRVNLHRAYDRSATVSMNNLYAMFQSINYGECIECFSSSTQTQLFQGHHLRNYGDKCWQGIDNDILGGEGYANMVSFQINANVLDFVVQMTPNNKDIAWTFNFLPSENITPTKTLKSFSSNRT